VAVEKVLVNAADISYGRPLSKNLCVTVQELCVESLVKCDERCFLAVKFEICCVIRGRYTLV
jgi:hypothetical protein